MACTTRMPIDGAMLLRPPLTRALCLRPIALAMNEAAAHLHARWLAGRARRLYDTDGGDPIRDCA